MLALDTESTGTDVRSDRIVTATLASITPGSPPVVRSWLANPGDDVEIPETAQAVHGISTERARAEGRPAVEVIGELVAALAQQWTPATVLICFNAPFDLSLIEYEARRHLDPHRMLEITGPVVDPLVIDKHADQYRKGKRTLGALCEHYQVTQDGPHSSDGDALAAARLAWRMAHCLPAIGGLDPAALHEHQEKWHTAQQLGFARYLDQLASGQADPAEREQLLVKAKDVRKHAGGWPLRSAAVTR